MLQHKQIRRHPMSVTTISIPLDSETAQAYNRATTEDKQKLLLLLGLWAREFVTSPRPLKTVMDEIGEKARSLDLTPEKLESLLHGE
jgi:hypothetical protein